MNVLLVDDSKAVLKIIRDMCLTVGLTVYTANDGLDAIATLNKLNVDLVLLDWNMPNLDGLGFLKENKKNMFTKAKIIVMTTDSSDSRLKICMENASHGGCNQSFNSKQPIDKTVSIFN